MKQFTYGLPVQWVLLFSLSYYVPVLRNSCSGVDSASSAGEMLPNTPSGITPFLLSTGVVLDLCFPFTDLISSVSFPCL